MLFTKRDENDLISILRTIPIHDAVFQELKYEYNKLTVTLSSFGKHRKIDLFFEQLRYSAFHPSSEWEGNESIYCLSVIQDQSEIRDYFSLNEKCYEDCMFFLFEMFSGSKLAIVCKELTLQP